MANLFPNKRDFLDFIPKLFDRDLEDRSLFNQFNVQIPKVDVIDKGDEYEISAELPGYSKNDLIVEYKNEYLTIKGQKNELYETNNDNEQYIRKERTYGSFERSFYIGEIDEQQIKGTFENGLLQLKVPKPYNKQNNSQTYRIPLDD
ncbi:Hsp20/alpha crystallin family protein [Piscibacillus halophilus]|uniref:Hsp20/alpha crystallin family protein n=1 Tax=Piscibacillus halophilus TaxID=571933 RepID=UPI002409AAF6|nr:Hsp20/alpha crystallin family protein [Piscibacillus halophilus]